MNVGDRVRIERDETRYPSKGTWPQFRGRTGTIVEINEDRERPHLTEYAVVFGKVSPASGSAKRTNRWDANAVAWFKGEEICALAPVRHTARRSPATRCTFHADNPGAAQGSRLPHYLTARHRGMLMALYDEVTASLQAIEHDTDAPPTRAEVLHIGLIKALIMIGQSINELSNAL